MTATEELPAVAHVALAMGRYRLGARLGTGGFGTVYAARDERLGRPVAVKVVPADGIAPERAQREARAVARLDHEGIVALFDAGEQNGCRYLVSELVEGRTLAQLEADGALSDRDVVRIGLALTDALAHAHDRGVVHRDVKPQNVIVPDEPGSRRGAAKLTDFGIAHLTGEDALTYTGDVVGTLAYMAPEQAAGLPAGEHADLYALGVVLYEAFAGVHPVRAGTPTATARRIGTRLAPLARHRGDLPPTLCAAIDRSVLPGPEERGELEELFDGLAAALPAVSDEGGMIAPHPMERWHAAALWPLVTRLLGPAATGALTYGALVGLTPEPAVAPLVAAGVAGLLTLLWPRTGWIATAAGVAGLLAFGPAPRPGAAAIVLLLALGPVLVLRTDGRAWALPAAAPLLGLVGLAGAYPALAGRTVSRETVGGWPGGRPAAEGATTEGRARRRLAGGRRAGGGFAAAGPPWATRLALGALGAWWMVLAEPLLERTLLFGAAEGTVPRAAFEGDVGIAAGDVVVPGMSSGALLLAVVWGLAALVLPWLVRGRSTAFDLVTASAWTAGTAAATAALADQFGMAQPRGLVPGAVLAGVITMARRRAEPPYSEACDEP